MVCLVAYLALCQAVSLVDPETSRSEFQRERERQRREVVAPQLERLGGLLGSALKLADKGQFIEAEAACAEALALVGEESSFTPSVKSTLAEVYAKQGMYRDAISLWEKYPKGPEGLSIGDLQANCYLQTGQPRKAAQIIEKYRENYERHVLPADLPMTHDESVTAVEASRLLVTAVALHSLSDKEKLQRLQAAYKRVPNSAAVNLHLAKALSRNGASWGAMKPHFTEAYRVGSPVMRQRVVDELMYRGRARSDIGF